MPEQESRLGSRSSGVLRVTIDLPGFWIGPNDTDEDAEESMALVSNQAVVTFIGAEGDSVEQYLRVLTGTLAKVEVVRRDAGPQPPETT